MWAARLKRQGEPLVLEKIAIPAPGPEEILIKLEACGVCHTDLHIRDGDEVLPTDRLPITLGHEGVGRIVKLGSNIRNWTVGERVGAPWLHDTCLSCRDCLTGHESVCSDQRAHGMHMNGAFAEYMVLKAAFAVPISEDVDPVTAAPLLCAGVTALGAVRKAKLGPGSICAIFGCGGLGQYGIQLAKQCGASVVAIDTDENRLEEAGKLGAQHCLLSSEKTGDALRRLGGVDACINFAPTAAIWPAIEQGLKSRGRFVSVAMPKEPVHLSLSWLTWVTPILTGTSVGGRQDLADMLALASQIDLSVPVERIPLRDADMALNRLSGRAGLKRVRGRLVIDFGEG